MTAPRQILPGSVYLVTRRCAQRQYLLRPSKTTNELFAFLLAVAAKRYGILVHVFCVMSNHVHLVVTDTHARLPEFHQYLDSLVARSVNSSLGSWETFWAPGSYSAVRLVASEDIVREAAYVLANPAKAGLVRTGHLWPGLWSDPDLIGAGPTRVARPCHRFFAKKSALPEIAELELTAPAGFASAAEFRDRVVAAVKVHEEEAARRFRNEFQGAVRVLKQKPRSRPRSKEPRRNLKPRVAAKDASKRVETLTSLDEFVRKYRAALARRRAGEKGVVFPAGTYQLRIAHGVPCAPCR
ncbi:MAG TPA: transposase [Anaeromyxobacteraceae bacterium]|nr:transposase [Anaeromyxobacteraceae bacterium]